ncbi:MAG: tetratricopeptide repeat protein [Deltaproteobacteria bacterium]|nr:tetratricopeptide repeat protein [Deltaproteobacteria bacterium]
MPPSEPQAGRRVLPAMCLALFLLPFVLYAPSVPGPFLLDGMTSIKTNPSIRISRLDPQSLWEAATGGYVKHRPIPHLTFALDYLAHGMEPAGFRLVNILIHSLAALALFALFFTTLSLAQPGASRARARNLAFFAALLWTAHPVQVQAVAYLVQRMTSLAALFFFLSVFAYARGRTAATVRRAAGWFALCAASGAGALLSKEIAATLPAILLLYEWYFLQGLSTAWLRKNAVWILVAAAALVAAALVYTNFSPLAYIRTTYQAREFTLSQRLFTELRVVVFYLSLLVAPLPGRQSLLHDFSLSSGWLDPASTLAAGLFLAALLAAAVVFAKRSRVFSFAVLWFLGNLVIESSVIGLELVFEHRMYLPVAFLFLAAATGLDRLVRVPKRQAAAVGAAALVLCGLTLNRSFVWGDGLALLREAAEANPENARPLYNISLNLLLEDKNEEAREPLLRAVAIDEAAYQRLFSRGRELAREGKSEQALWFFRRALDLKGRLAEGCNNLGTLARRQGRLKDAEKYLKESIRWEPRQARARQNLALLYFGQGRIEECVEQLKIVLAWDPENAEVMNNLGAVMARQGNFAEAVSWYEKSLETRPGDLTTRVNLADVLAADARPEAALAHYQKILEDKPDWEEVHYRVGRLLFTRRRPEQALDHLNRCLEEDPDHKEAAILADHVKKVIEITRQDMKRAADALKTAVDPAERAHLNRCLVVLHNRLGEDEKALEYARAAMDLETNPESMNRTGLFLLRLGRHQEAQDLFSRAARSAQGREKANAYYHLAVSRALQGNREGAVEALKRYLEAGGKKPSLARDPELEPLRDNPWFRGEILAKAAS